MLNGNRIGSLFSEVNAIGGENLKKEYQVKTALGLEWRALESIRLQAAYLFTPLDSKKYPKHKATPVLSVRLEF